MYNLFDSESIESNTKVHNFRSDSKFNRLEVHWIM